MTQSHRNRSWRGQWTVHRDGTVAVHKSGFTVVASPQAQGFKHRDRLRPQDDFRDLYRRGMQLLDEVTGRRPTGASPAPLPDPEPDDERDPELGPEMR